MVEYRGSNTPSSHALPVQSGGAGLKFEHARDILQGETSIDFFEIHAENYMGAGGPPHHFLRQIRSDYPLSMHGVGLSIGSAGALDQLHLVRLKAMIERYQPRLFSEHLAWSSHGDVFFNDLLPLPYNEETLARVVEHVDQVQTHLGMRMLLENPSTYLTFGTSTIREIDFLQEVAVRSGCGLLLDVNNVYVCAINHGFDAMGYINEFPITHVGEIHLAGYAEDKDGDGNRMLIDAHGSRVSTAVWSLYRRALERMGPIPTLIEWDNDVPPFPVLAGEVDRAKAELLSHGVRRNRRLAA